jgi:hypothetical protein
MQRPHARRSAARFVRLSMRWLAVLMVAGIVVAQPPQVGTPVVPASVVSLTDLRATIVRGSQVSLSWAASGATRFDVVAAAVTEPGPDDELLTTLDGDARQALVPIPVSARQVVRVCARGAVASADVCAATRLTNVVIRSDDYDPYALGGWPPEPPVPGTLRAVIAGADRGSIIGFAADVTTIDIYGVAMFYRNPVDPAAIQPGEGWQDGHLIIDRDLVVSGRPGDPVALIARSGCSTCPPAEALTYRSRVVRVLEGVTAELESLELAGGAFVFDGAGIHNDGTLTLREVAVRNNRAWYEGGGIHNGPKGVLTLIDTTLRDNVAAVLDDEVGATFDIRAGSASIDLENGGFGGGLFNAPGGTVTVRGGTIDANHAKISGGGLYNLGTLELTGTVVRGNVADHTRHGPAGAPLSLGGGAFSAGRLIASSTTIEANHAHDAGGGLALWPGGTSTLDGVIIRGNSANVGGGVRLEHRGDAAEAFVATGVTIEGNVGDDLSVRELDAR